MQSVNELALVAVRLGDMEKFKENLIIGANGSNALDSDIRRKEVKIAWSAAMQQWPHENQVSKLAEVLVEDKSV